MHRSVNDNLKEHKKADSTGKKFILNCLKVHPNTGHEGPGGSKGVAPLFL
jgi:hypothetical protein